MEAILIAYFSLGEFITKAFINTFIYQTSKSKQNFQAIQILWKNKYTKINQNC